MSKAVMLSIRPKWCEKIASGEKTIEVRKTRPKKLKNPFKCYIYCTQGRDARRLRGSWGKVIGEFTCDGFWIGSPRNTNPIFCMAACMDGFDTEKYAKDKILYGWHISDLKIYDTPRELGEFERPYECGECNAKWASECNACYEENKIKRAPQSWCYVEAMEDV
jgi:predicted transcriptional regulator